MHTWTLPLTMPKKIGLGNELHPCHLDLVFFSRLNMLYTDINFIHLLLSYSCFLNTILG